MTHETIKPISKLIECFGQTVPIFGLSFDKKGVALSPKTRDATLEHIVSEGISDVIIYSHGWNTEYPLAKGRYEEFLRGLSDIDSEYPKNQNGPFKPLMIGIFWPSTILVFPSDKTPEIASSSDSIQKDAELADLSALLGPNLTALLLDRISNAHKLNADEAEEVATALAMTLSKHDDTEIAAVTGTISPADILAIWEDNGGRDAQTPARRGFTDFGPSSRPTSEEAEIAGTWRFDPRALLRLVTMWQMKDRAGVVGSNGVADTIERLLNETKARVHLLGHSYGCKVVTTGLVTAKSARKATSLTLLQPAISHLAFARDAHDGTSGAFRTAFDRVEKPVFSTYSTRDIPLYHVFHLAARRSRDVGELQFAAGGLNPYLALGACGPVDESNGEVVHFGLPAPGTRYPTLAPSVQIVGLNGSDGIASHVDVNNDYVFWAVSQQLR